jgi:hypothetical protein
MGFNPKTQTEDQDSGQDGRQIPCCQGGEGRGFAGKEVVLRVDKKLTKVLLP